jgi:TM2 domain
VAEGDRFCPACGKPVQNDALTPTSAKDREVEIAWANEVQLVEMMNSGQRAVYMTRQKNPTTAVMLALFLGGLGGQFFYFGQIGAGLVCCLFCWTFIPAVVGLVHAFGIDHAHGFDAF